MTTRIYTMDERTGAITFAAAYTVEPKQAMINFIKQTIDKDFNTWAYPQNIKGIRESTKAKNHFYYDDKENSRIIAAYPE